MNNKKRYCLLLSVYMFFSVLCLFFVCDKRTVFAAGDDSSEEYVYFYDYGDYNGYMVWRDNNNAIQGDNRAGQYGYEITLTKEQLLSAQTCLVPGSGVVLVVGNGSTFVTMPGCLCYQTMLPAGSFNEITQVRIAGCSHTKCNLPVRNANNTFSLGELTFATWAECANYIIDNKIFDKPYSDYDGLDAPELYAISMDERNGVRYSLLSVYENFEPGVTGLLAVYSIHFTDMKGQSYVEKIYSAEMAVDDVDVATSPLVVYRNGNVYRVDLFFHNLSQVLKNKGYTDVVQINEIDIEVWYKYEDVSSRKAYYVYDVVNGTITGNAMTQDNEEVTFVPTVSPSSGNLSGSINPDVAPVTTPSGLISWLINSIEGLSLDLSKIFNAFVRLISSITGFLSVMGSIYEMILGSELGMYIRLALMSVCVVGILRAVRG